MTEKYDFVFIFPKACLIFVYVGCLDNHGAIDRRMILREKIHWKCRTKIFHTTNVQMVIETPYLISMFIFIMTTEDHS